jgi:hypothetical protein
MNKILHPFFLSIQDVLKKPGFRMTKKSVTNINYH